MNLDSPLYSGFVKPELCKDLHIAGVTANTAYHYRITEGCYELCTFAFDPDDVYAQAFANLDAVSATQILPAYQLKEIEKTLPNYLLCRQNNHYEISLEHIYGLHGNIRDDRMPDAFAKVLLQLIRNRTVRLHNVNELITQL